MDTQKIINEVTEDMKQTNLYNFKCTVKQSIQNIIELTRQLNQAQKRLDNEKKYLKELTFEETDYNAILD